MTNDQEQQESSNNPQGGCYYEVRQGECLSSIAFERRLFWKTLWNHSANHALRDNERNPSVLLPGDVVFVPNLQLKEETRSTEQKHRFRLKGVPAQLCIRFMQGNESLDNLYYKFQLDQAHPVYGKTDGEGWLIENIPPTALQCRVALEGGRQYKFELGHLDPVSEVTGIQARLNNLGFSCGAVDGKLGPKTTEALKMFQTANGLQVDGKANQTTQDKLVELHGS